MLFGLFNGSKDDLKIYTEEDKITTDGALDGSIDIKWF